MPSPRVFVSYSHRDRDAKALQQLQRFLTPLERDGVVSVWADTELKGGDDWKQEIFQALADATVAVLLISQDFLASDFVTREEMPRILQREAEGRLTVLPVFLSPSSVADVGFPDPRTSGRSRILLSKFQGFGGPQEPLASLDWAARERIYTDLARQLRGLAGSGLAPSPPAVGSVSPAPVVTAGPARAYELTIQLEDRGESVLISYHLPGREPIGSATVQWGDIKRLIDPIHEFLDRANNLTLLPQLGDPKGWGEVLFGLLFGPVDRWEQIFRALLGRAEGQRPNPPLHPVRLRIHTEDPQLSSLPWRLTAWKGQPLLDAGWVFTTTNTVDPVEDFLSTAPCNVLVLAPQLAGNGGGPHEPDHVRALLDVLKKAWPTGREPGYAQVARTRAELAEAFRVHRPAILYVYGYGARVGGRPGLLLEGDSGPEPLALADLRHLFAGQGHIPAVIYLNTEGLTQTAGSTPDQILSGVPLLLWRRRPEWSADSTTTALHWLRRWLSQGEDPLAAFHAVHLETYRTSSEACTVAIHSNYRTWRTTVYQGVAAARSYPALQIDRDRPKALVQKHVEELVRGGDRRVMAIVPYALKRNSIALFWEQLRHHLELSLGHLADIKWVRLQFPPGRSNLRRDLEGELKLQLGAELNEPPRHLLRRYAPKAVGHGRRPVLWLNWGSFGEGDPALDPLLKDDQLADWLRFSSAFLGPECPDDLRIVSYVAQEVPAKQYNSFVQKLRELRQAPWCRTPVFRLSDGEPLEEVDVLHLLDFLEDRNNSSCDAQIRREVAERIIAKTGGVFDATVALIQEAESGSWYDLLARLRREQGAA